VESNHHSRGPRGYSPLSSPVLSVRKTEGRASGFEPEPRGSQPRMLPLHHDHQVSGDDRTRTGACSPDKRVLLPLSYVPMHSAGGIRTHGLELMRLARTASPLRRKQLGRAGKAGPAFGRRRKRAPYLPGWSRTSDLRRPKPAGWPNSPTGSSQSTCRCRLRRRRLPRARWKSIPIEVIMARHSRAGLRSVNTPGGTRTRSFRIESPASFLFDHRGLQALTAGLEPALRD
jgi:hypothetical protein